MGGREFVVLHDDHSGEQLELEVRAWFVLRCADGTRDAEGIAAAVSRLGVDTTAQAVVALLAQLNARGALESGPPVHAPDTVTPRPRPRDLPTLAIEPLPDYRFDCDGSGGCCRAYDSILFTPGDRDRAKACLEGETRAGLGSTRWFTPDHGSAPTPLAVPLYVDGGCGFLGDDGLCEIHRRTGLEGKPRACAAFPTVVCSDGVSLRVSAVPECACVLREAAAGRGEVLGRPWTSGADLPVTTAVHELPEPVPFDGEQSLSGAQVRARVDQAMRELSVADMDPAQACWQWADTWVDRAPEPASFGPYLEQLRPLAKDLLRRLSAWRAADDWVVSSLRWLVGTLHLLDTPGIGEALLEPLEARDPAERIYVRTSLWAYQGFDESPVATVLRTHAVKIWIARAMAEVPLAPSANAVPLASLSMLLRGHGLQRAWE